MGEQQYLPAPFEGMDVSVPAHLLEPTKSPYLRNFLVDGDRVRLRGPLRWLNTISGALEHGGAAMAAEGMMFPFWSGQYVVVRTVGQDGLPTADSAADERYWPWESFEGADPALTTTNPPTFGRPVYWDPIANAFTNGTAPATQHLNALGPHQAAYKEGIYAITTGDDNGNYIRYPSVTGSRFHRQTLLIKLGAGPTTAPTTAVAAGIEAPRFGQGLASYAQRLWVLGGMPPSNSATADTVAGQEITGPLTAPYPRILYPNTLWFTNIDVDPLIAANWHTNGVHNKLVVGSETPNDYGVALTAATKYMVVHKKRSTWVLTGSGTDSFAFKQISASSGLVDPRARVLHDDIVYWVSREGLVSYDGAEVSLLSDAVNPSLRPGVETRSGSSRQSGSFVQLSALPNSYLLLQTGRHDLYGGGDDTVDQSWLYHIPTGRWMIFYTDNYANPGAPVGTVRSGTNFYHITTQGVHDATYLTDPLLTVGANRGNDYSPSGALQSFPSECYFVPVRLAAPWARAAIERYGMETIQEFRSGGTVGELLSQIVRYTRRATGGQEPTPTTDLTAAASITGAQINASDTPAYLPFISPYDAPTETTDVQVRVSRDYTAGVAGDPVVWSEIVGAYLEWRVTHERVL